MKDLIKASDIIEKLKETAPETYAEIKANTEDVKKKFKHGGKRTGAGRKPVSLSAAKNRSVRLTDEEYELFQSCGGTKWLRDKLKEAC
jgi:hypothetical protein